LRVAASIAGVLALGAFVAPGLAQTRPPPPPADERAVPGRPGWAVDATTGCWIWNADPRAGEAVAWSAGCGGNGRARGRGTLEWRHDGQTSRYAGELSDGRPHGRGIYEGADGTRYEGEHRDGRRHGSGVFTTADGFRYEGGFDDGEFSGSGVQTWSDGARYEGGFRDGAFSGRGVYVWADGTRYEGEFRDGAFNGNGVQTWPDGDRYEGEFRDDRAHGAGEFLTGGERLVGTWVDGCFRRGALRASVNRPLDECP
jgi:hypothetical protein